MVARQQIAGEAAEAAAARRVGEAGLIVLARNWSCRYGEIDLIARDGETVVFIEVRLRSATRYGGARASVTRDKQRRLVTAAELWLARQPAVPPCRFDVIAVDADGTLEWIRGAFEARSD